MIVKLSKTMDRINNRMYMAKTGDTFQKLSGGISP